MRKRCRTWCALAFTVLAAPESDCAPVPTPSPALSVSPSCESAECAALHKIVATYCRETRCVVGVQGRGVDGEVLESLRRAGRVEPIGTTPARDALTVDVREIRATGKDTAEVQVEMHFTATDHTTCFVPVKRQRAKWRVLTKPPVCTL